MTKGNGPKITGPEDSTICCRVRNPRAETEAFFDAEFLKKLERLRLIAKRLLGQRQRRASLIPKRLQP